MKKCMTELSSKLADLANDLGGKLQSNPDQISDEVVGFGMFLHGAAMLCKVLGMKTSGEKKLSVLPAIALAHLSYDLDRLVELVADPDEVALQKQKVEEGTTRSLFEEAVRDSNPEASEAETQEEVEGELAPFQEYGGIWKDVKDDGSS